ncbi:hypothetical protein Vadar_020129 [Vaccinium darrowii]|uniref:Uncharacterized protein n=1 Tax=Vaccinium darrowii TaxID=229202 RepID=A0ACB7XS64_9ERIC|nr:hypothetical protein Vadar_020129 [Vaccinium darrowii]
MVPSCWDIPRFPGGVCVATVRLEKTMISLTLDLWNKLKRLTSVAFASITGSVPSGLHFNTNSPGKDVSIENIHQGFTHVFESTFESVEGIAEYISHRAHVEFANIFLPVLDKVLLVDYKPTPVQL